MASFTTSAFLLLCIATTIMYHVGGTPVEKRAITPSLTARLHNISRQKRDSSTVPCCLISNCEAIPLNLQGHEAYKCYKKEYCGDACNRGHSRRLSSQYAPHTAGYKIKSHYFKTKCELNQCFNYRFDCARCPDPSKSAFSVYALSGDCIRCYY